MGEKYSIILFSNGCTLLAAKIVLTYNSSCAPQTMEFHRALTGVMQSSEALFLVFRSYFNLVKATAPLQLRLKLTLYSVLSSPKSRYLDGFENSYFQVWDRVQQSQLEFIFRKGFPRYNMTKGFKSGFDKTDHFGTDLN